MKVEDLLPDAPERDVEPDAAQRPVEVLEAICSASQWSGFTEQELRIDGHLLHSNLTPLEEFWLEHHYNPRLRLKWRRPSRSRR